MSAVFLQVVNRSIAACWLIAAVMVLRRLLRRAPKWTVCLLWALVAVRLVCTISIESVLSLIPSAETFPEQVISGPSFDIQTGIGPIDGPVNEYLGDRYFEGVTVPAENGANVTGRLSVVWLLGMLVLGSYALVRYVRLRRSLATAVRLREGIYQSEYVSSPFVLGFFGPRIYLPFGMDSGDEAHVIAHERAHIARLDHWWKPLGFCILTLHWFNPLVWVAYGLFCRDLELACDERVIRGLGCEARADYTQALVRCSLGRSRIAACPLAFGEVGVKERVRSILNYRKPAFWAAVMAAGACVLAAVCFLTDPVPSRSFGMKGDSISDLEPQRIIERIRDVEKLDAYENVYMNADNFDLRLNADFTWEDSQAIRYFFYQDDAVRSAQLRIFPEEQEYFVTESGEWTEQKSIFTLRNYLDALKYLPTEQIRALCPDAERYILRHVEGGTPGEYERSITYTLGGAGEIDGWFIHLQLLPIHGSGGSACGPIEVFYGESAETSAVFCWFDRTMEQNVTRTMEISAFPGVLFTYSGSDICAYVEDGGAGGESIILNGMPILDAYLCDLTGDGLPEICTTQCWGSGMIDERIVIFDYAARRGYTLEDRGTYDYRLRIGEDGRLYAARRRYNQSEVVDSFRLIWRDSAIALEHDRVLTADPYRFTATVLEVHDGYLLVEPVPGSRELASASRIEVPFEQEDGWKLEPGVTVVIGYGGQLQETYPARIPDGTLLMRIYPQKVDLIPMVAVDGWIYCDTGRAVPAEIDPSAVLGQITSTVQSHERPTKEGQSNFGYIGADYARFEDGIVVLIDGEWTFFAPEDA